MNGLLRIARSPLGIGALIVLALVIVVAIFAPIIWGPAAEVIDTTNINAGPSPEHLIGTDGLGRDLLLRTLVATRLTILLALGATAIALAIGIILGAAPLLMGRSAGRVAITAVNIAIAFPAILLALCLATVLGIGAFAAMAAIGIAGAPTFARFCQTLIAGVANRDYIAAARIAGAGRFTILFRHVLPNIAEPLIVNATIGAGGALLAFAGLSFLGLGVQSPDYDWGRLMNEGLSRIYLNPLAALAPGLAVVITGLAFNLSGEAMAKTFSLPTMSLLPGSRLRRARKAEAMPDRAALAPAPSPTAARDDLVLDVRNLRVSLPTGVEAVRGVDLRIGHQEAVGIVGESGSGKSLTALAVAQLLESPLTVTADTLSLLGNDLRAEPLTREADAERRRLLGTSVSVVFQDPMTSLNPTMKVGTQLAEVPRTHSGMSWRAALDYAAQRLQAVGIPDHLRRSKQYPHEFSGGMRQRAMIAMSIMAQPKLVIADEPTTALDVTVQQQVLDLLARIRRENDAALLLISHDIAVVREVTDRILVMYAGRVVEEIASERLGTDAAHPYTRALVAAVPDLATDRDLPLATIPGRPVDPAHVPAGCAFAARCPFATALCRSEDPALQPLESSAGEGTEHRVACWHPVGVDGLPMDGTRGEAPAAAVSEVVGV